ncbi:hypothetical protein KFE25_006571 [Diacronema lutheri]|uniref:DUF962 domain-containing protein n=1 Tax=Diacronema lutheri TaxID=2081491 RepID=A0A8J5X2B5_DIALT|nr:hypothetical protein KFE25_006571 [Diacronema lutheri]
MAVGDALARLRAAYASELRLYRAHHACRANWLLHAACVPLEWAACLLALAQLAPRAPWLAQLALGAYVLPLHPPISVALGPAQLALAALVDALGAALPSTRARLAVALCAWCGSWLLQVPVGHWLLERNQPAMVTRLTLNSAILAVPLAWDWGGGEPRGEPSLRGEPQRARGCWNFGCWN